MEDYEGVWTRGDACTLTVSKTTILLKIPKNVKPLKFELGTTPFKEGRDTGVLFQQWYTTSDGETTSEHPARIQERFKFYKDDLTGQRYISSRTYGVFGREHVISKDDRTPFHQTNTFFFGAMVVLVLFLLAIGIVIGVKL